MRELQTLDYGVLFVYLVLMAGVGIFFSWFVKDIQAYFKGGGQIPWPVAGISNYMSMFTTFVFVAYAGVAYEHGLVAVTVLWCTVLPCVTAALLFAARWRRAELTTPVEYLETRFGLPVRQVFSWMGLLMRFLDNIVRLYATGVFLAAVTPLSVGEAIILSGAIMTLYTMIGGLWAVTVMDTIQFVVLLLATLVLFPLSYKAVGGFAGIAEVDPNHLNWFNGPKGAPLWLIVYYLMIILKYNANWAFVQRLYSVRDESDSRKVAWLCAALFFVMPIFFMFPPLAAKVLIPDLPDKEMAYVALATHLVPVGVMGLMLAAMFSATMSSLNSEFNVMAGVLTKDIYQRLVAPHASPTNLMWVGRIGTVGVGTLITFGALSIGGFGGAFEANKLFTSIFAIPLAVPLLLGLLLKKPDAWAAGITVLGGAASALLLSAVPGLSWESATLRTVLICITLFIGTGLVRKHSSARREQIEAFFRKLDTPIPEEDKPNIDPGFGKALGYLFAGAFGVVGLMFTGVSALSLNEFSGRVGVIGGVLCCVLGLVCWLQIKRTTETGPLR